MTFLEKRNLVKWTKVLSGSDVYPTDSTVFLGNLTKFSLRLRGMILDSIFIFFFFLCPFLIFCGLFCGNFCEFWWAWITSMLPVSFICFIFLNSPFNFTISWFFGWSFVFFIDCSLEFYLDLFLLVWIGLNDLLL